MQKTQAESCSDVMEVDVDKSVLLSGLTSKEKAEIKHVLPSQNHLLACMGTEGEFV
jgi:hypothetical protein